MIKVSLRTKLLLVTSTLLFLAVTSYLFLAVHMFNNDKTTYIFEGNATLVNTIAAETAANFRSVQKTISLLATNSTTQGSRESLQKLFDSEPEIIELSVFRSDNYPAKPLLELVRNEFTNPYKIIPRDFQLLKKAAVPRNAIMQMYKPMMRSVIIKENVPLLQIIQKQKISGVDHIIISHLRQDRRIKLFSRSETFTTYLTDRYGNILAHPDVSKILKKQSIGGTPTFNNIVQNKFDTAVRAMGSGQNEMIVAYSKIPEMDLVVISEISKSKAFLASQKLIEKSIMFALLILSTTFVVSLLFAKRITRSLERLYLATQEIAKGNFLVQVTVQGRDEVGALSASFNQMAGEISRLMEETADKARMEKELETAQLVQDNFFPVTEIDAGDFSIAAFYKPAGECGGDWWGHFKFGNKLVILIGDATGHGVPSALITAAAQSCCSTLQSISDDFKAIELTPALILEKLNNSIYRASRGTVKMTFFCGIIDLDLGKIAYANASHEMPLLCHADQSNLTAPRQKKDVVVCTARAGLILGSAESCEYQEQEIDILPGDVFVIYTDGLTECKNRENQMYGKGRFLRNIYKNAQMSAVALRETIVKDAFDFYGDRVRDDDVTLVVIKHRENSAMLRKAG